MRLQCSTSAFLWCTCFFWYRRRFCVCFRGRCLGISCTPAGASGKIAAAGYLFFTRYWWSALILHTFLSFHLLSKAPYLLDSISCTSLKFLLPNTSSFQSHTVISSRHCTWQEAKCLMAWMPSADSYQEGGLSPVRSRGSPKDLVALLCSQLLFVVGKSAPAFDCIFLLLEKLKLSHQTFLQIFCPLILDQPKHRQPFLFQAKTFFSGSMLFHSNIYLVVVLSPSCLIFLSLPIILNLCLWQLCNQTRIKMKLPLWSYPAFNNRAVVVTEEITYQGALALLSSKSLIRDLGNIQ